MMADVHSGSNQRVLVSYSAPQTILSSAKWQQVRAALTAQLPLRNIHWKSASRTTIRTIQELDVSLVPLDTIRDEHTQIPVTLLEKPLLNIYIVVCQNTDIEGYRTTVKKQIRDWHSVITMRKNQEWLILHIVKPDAKAPSGNFFQLKGSVYEKIKADFNSEKRERCVQVSWSSETDNPAVWAEFMNKVKDGVLSAFDSAVLQREEEVKRSESQRQMPGWNFCTFFILKESLANSFDGVCLFEDAYNQYDELETTFYQVLKEKNLSWFGTLINPSDGDDSSPLLSVSKKPYRDLILANTISIFDLRIYLLSRQCQLLAQKGRMNEICRKAAAFLGAFGRRLRDVEKNLAPFFLQSWTYSSALSVVSQCDQWASTLDMTGSRLNAFNAAKGELLELARNQLDMVGVRVGHLPSKPPFATAYEPLPLPVDTSEVSSTSRISNAEILAAIENGDPFYELYVTTTNRAIDMYAKAGRRKFALRLHGSLAALDLHREHLATALTTYTSLPAHYAPHMWNSLETFMLSRALDTHSDMKKPKDTEWIHILLSFLKSYIENLGSELLLHTGGQVTYMTKLVNDMSHAAAELDGDLAHPDHPAFSIQVTGNTRIAETRDGCFLNISVRNRLPCHLPANEVSVVLAGRDHEQYKFVSSIEELPPGVTTVALFCPISITGTYLHESSELCIAHLRLQWTHRKIPASKTPRTFNELPVLVRFPKDLLAMDVKLNQPTSIELGEPSTLLVTVSTGRNYVSKATLKLSSPSVKFRLGDARISGDKKPVETEIINETICLRKIAKDQSVSIRIPHSDIPAFNAMKTMVEVEYITDAEPTIVRTLRVSRILQTTLPISVNVEDFFRGTRLLSKFTISTTSHQHVRISDACLEAQEGGLDGVKIVPTVTKNRGVITVTPAQPANFLFYIDSSRGPVRETLTLHIKYRMLREEVEEIVGNVASNVISKSSPTAHHWVTLVNKLIMSLEHDATWVDLYGLTGQLNVPVMQENVDDELIKLLDQARKLLQDHRHPSLPIGHWREIKIPVDVPYMNIVAATRVQILSTPFADISAPKPLSLYAGQPISAVLMIHTSFHWGSSTNDKNHRYMLRYDIEEMVKDWLVSGPKRGDFTASDGGTHSVPITLIALHHGELALPKVVVTALPIAGELTMGSMAIPSIEAYQVHGAEKALVLPRGGRSTFVIGMGSG
ncbi:trafficking protein particle complex subunit 10 [Collybia nuda]|uniref:Trafficking protein particle complex subunit 10 n=1 Tax=Collybia nuda TaxID=64659 RepID=A0A9P5YAC2_9AGAR|nr:trafficking protein particle complex subunit 10 [Collybia nuda]